MLVLPACGRDNALDVYREQMEQFFEQVAVYNSYINAIDPEADNAISELLAYLNSLEATVKQMAAYEVPPHFNGVEELADQAETFMSEALKLYNEAYTGESYDEEKAEAAKVNYERANLRLRYIGEILRGETPSYVIEQ
jgi:hypothetical protein